MKLAKLGKGYFHLKETEQSPSFFIQQDRDYEYGAERRIDNMADLALLMRDFHIKVAAGKPKDKDILCVGYLTFIFGNLLLNQPSALLGYIGWYSEDELKDDKGNMRHTIIYNPKTEEAPSVIEKI